MLLKLLLILFPKLLSILLTFTLLFITVLFGCLFSKESKLNLSLNALTKVSLLIVSPPNKFSSFILLSSSSYKFILNLISLNSIKKLVNTFNKFCSSLKKFSSIIKTLNLFVIKLSKKSIINSVFIISKAIYLTFSILDTLFFLFVNIVLFLIILIFVFLFFWFSVDGLSNNEFFILYLYASIIIIILI